MTGSGQVLHGVVGRFVGLLAALVALTVMQVGPAAATPPDRARAGLLPVPPLPNPLCGLIGPLDPLLCALNALQVQWVTKYKRPNGTIVSRVTVSPILTPAPLNVDDDLLPDVVATPFAFSLSHFRITVDRMLTEFGALPLSIQAVILDPTGGSLPRESIQIGYDALDSKTPNHWQADIELGDFPGGQRITTTATTTPRTAGDPLTLTGGLFNGPPLAPTDPLGGRLRYAHVPPVATVDLGIGDDLEVGLDTSSPTPVDASAELIDSAAHHEQKAQVHLEDAPATLDFTLHPAGPDARTITYSASARLARLDVGYREWQDAQQTLGVVAHASGVPTSVVIDQTAAKVGSVTTDSSFDSVEAAFASGEPVLGSAPGPYVKLLNNAALLNSFAVRLEGLKRATFDATDVIRVDTTITPAGRKPLDLAIDQPALGDAPSLHLTGRINSLPEQLTLAADLDATSIAYDGHGQGIDEITAVADSDAPFFERANHLELRALDIPASETITITSPDNPLLRTGATITASAPLGTVEFAGSSTGVVELPAGTGAGALIRDTATSYRVGARAFDLESVSITKRASGVIELEATQRPGPFGVLYEDDDRTVTGNVLDLPHHVAVSILPPRIGHPGFASIDSSAPIDEINAEITSKVPFFDRPFTTADPDRLDLRVIDVPASLTVDAAITDTGGSFTLDRPIGRLVARLTSGPSDSLGPDDSVSGVLLKDTPDAFVAYGSLADVTHLGFSSGPEPTGDHVSPLHVELTTANPTPALELEAVLDFVDGLPAGTIDGTITDLPAKVTIDRDDAGIHWSASGPTGELSITGRSLPDGPANTGGLNSVDVLVRDLPSAFTILPGPDDMGFDSESGEAFGRIFVQATDSATPDPGQAGDPEGGTNGAYFNQTSAGANYLAWVRLLDVRRAVFTPEEDGNPGKQKLDLQFDPANADPAAMSLYAHLASENSLTMDVAIPEPTHTLLLNLNNDGEFRVSYDADHEDLGTVRIKPTIDDVLGGDFEITGLPPNLTFCVASGQEQADGCDRQIKHTFDEFNGVTIPAAAFAFLETEETHQTRQVGFNGVLCLKPSTTDSDHPNNPPGPHYTPDCEIVSPGVYASNSLNKIEFYGIQVNDFRFEMLDGDSLELDEDGDPLEDSLIALHLDTPSFLGKVSFFSNDIDDASLLHTKTSLDAHGPTPLSADDYTLYVDTNGAGAVPGTFYVGGDIDCTDTALNLFEASGAPVDFFSFYPQVC